MSGNYSICSRAWRAWKATCRKQYPNEAFAYLLGCGDMVIDIWIPEDLAEYATPNEVTLPAHWYIEAEQEAASQNLRVVGCVHSHCDDEYDGCPSNADLDNISGALWGITEVRNGRVKRTRWRGKLEKVEVSLD